MRLMVHRSVAKECADENIFMLSYTINRRGSLGGGHDIPRHNHYNYNWASRSASAAAANATLMKFVTHQVIKYRSSPGAIIVQCLVPR